MLILIKNLNQEGKRWFYGYKKNEHTRMRKVFMRGLNVTKIKGGGSSSRAGMTV